MSLSEHEFHLLDQEYGRMEDRRQERIAGDRAKCQRMIAFVEAVAYGHYDSSDGLQETAIALLQEVRGGK